MQKLETFQLNEGSFNSCFSKLSYLKLNTMVPNLQTAADIHALSFVFNTLCSTIRIVFENISPSI